MFPLLAYQILHDLSKTITSVDVASEEVEARTGWRKEYRIAWLSHLTSMSNSLLHRQGRGYMLHLAMEGPIELEDIGSEENQTTCS